MKNLTNDEIIFIIENICESGRKCFEEKCPLHKECLHFYTGENCGSALEEEEKENDCKRND